MRLGFQKKSSNHCRDDKDSRSANFTTHIAAVSNFTMRIDFANETCNTSSLPVLINVAQGVIYFLLANVAPTGNYIRQRTSSPT
jgi:hypothetical protein